jgi:ABC-2 type transport system ATP-binding protein
MEIFIETENLTKYYNSKVGCEKICLSVSGGQIFGFLGPNGAGKSTLVKMLVGLLFPTAGKARVLGKPLGDLSAKRKIGFLPENFHYQEWLTGYELLCLHSSLGHLDKNERRDRIGQVLEIVGLTGRENQRIRTYSKGMRQRLGLACALLTDPELLFLDEPTSALDPLGRREVREIMLELKRKGKTVFLNSHLLSEVEMICDRVAIIRKGKIIAQGTLEKLLGDAVVVEIEIDKRTPQLDAALAKASFAVNWSGKTGRVALNQKEDRARLAGIIIQNGGRLYTLAPRQRSLEDLFINLIQKEVEICSQ